MEQRAPLTPDLRLHDVRTFVVVCRSGSVSAAARELSVTPSQVSKALRRLEDQLGATLLVRSTTGVSPSDAGRRLLPSLQTMLATADQLGRAVAPQQRTLTFAAPSFVLDAFAPSLLAADIDCRIRLIELPPMLVRVYAASSAFDAAISLGDTPVASGWDRVQLGTSTYVLFASPETASTLGPQPVPVDRLRDVPFVSPIFLADGQFLPVEDDCPLGRTDRTLGCETTTLGLGLLLVSHTDQVVFGPRFSGKDLMQRGGVVPVEVEGWQFQVSVNLWCNPDRVFATERRKLAESLKAALRETEPR